MIIATTFNIQAFQFGTKAAEKNDNREQNMILSIIRQAARAVLPALCELQQPSLHHLLRLAKASNSNGQRAVPIILHMVCLGFWMHNQTTSQNTEMAFHQCRT